MALTDVIPSKAIDVLQENMLNRDEQINLDSFTYENRPAPNGNEKTRTFYSLNEEFDALLPTLTDTVNAV